MSLPRAFARALAAELAALVRLGRVPLSHAFAPLHRPWIGVALALAAFGWYAWLGSEIAAGTFLERYNQAFDYDPTRYVLLWTADPSEWEEETHSYEYQVRHPFLRLLGVPLGALADAGLDGELVATFFVALCGAGAVLAAYLLLRVHGAALPESVLLTAFFATSTTQTLHSIAVESYAPTALCFALLYLFARLRLADPESRGRSKVLLALAAFGTTTTNVLQVGLTELCVWRASTGWRAALVRTAAFALVVGVLAGAIAWFGGFLRLGGETLDPVHVARNVNYAGHFDGELAAKVGLDAIAVAFFAFAFAAPRFSAVPMADAAPMLDFRAFDYPAWVLPALGLWLAACGAGLVAWLARKETRAFGAALALGILFDLALFARYQYRQSVFLGASHAHFAIFALVIELARRLSCASAGVRRPALALAAAAAAALAWNDQVRVLELVRAFAR